MRPNHPGLMSQTCDGGIMIIPSTGVRFSLLLIKISQA
jgi:hypothetical protein